ncbi:MAG: HD domain-containing protein, partial [Bacteroidetes bacterium]
NDPVHGFIRLPEGRVMQALEHPYVQRLRRISQLGLAQFVYPGATHTRFNHALGVLHLAQEALLTLQTKGLTLPSETQEATLLAALLHDIGHGPFSHTLEGQILPLSHEEIGYLLLQKLEKDLGSLQEVQALWQGTHPQAFLCELIAGQLDVDRLDYLTRDSFFTGVQEGMVGTERLVYTMTVAEGRLVIEEKGLNSVEKFIVTRRFMYWQVYLHKAVLSAEQLLRRWWQAWQHCTGNPSLCTVEEFLKVDEAQVWSWIHQGAESTFPPLRALSRALLWRVLYKVRFVSPEEAPFLREAWEAHLPAAARTWKGWFWTEGQAENTAYWPEGTGEIPLLGKDGCIRPLSEVAPWLKGLSGPTKRFFAGGIPAASLESLLR